MTNIAHASRIGEGWFQRFGRRLRHGQTARRQHLLDARNEPLEEIDLAKSIAAGTARFPDGIAREAALRRAAGDLKSNRNDGLELVDVGHIIDEALRLAGVNKADGGRIARGEDSRLGQSIKAGGAGAETPVRGIRSAPIVWVIIPSAPIDPVLARMKLIKPFHTRALYAAQLLDRAPFRGLFAKAQGIHLPHDFEPRAFIEREARLKQQAVRSRAAGLARGIKPDARLADPDDERSRARGKRNGGMADARARLEHQACEPSDRDVRTHAILVHDYEGAIEHIELPLLDEHDGGALLEGNGPWRGQARNGRAGAAQSALLISISPQPNPFALPKPWARDCKNSSGLRTLRVPLRSSWPSTIARCNLTLR